MDLNQLREKAAAHFKESGFPTTKEELWRFTDVSAVAKAEFTSDWKPAEVDHTALSPIILVFENGKLSHEKSNVENLPSGVSVGSIMDRADERLGTLADSQSAFVSANTAYFSDGAFIKVADGVELEAPIHLVFLADADGAAVHVRNFISCGNGAKVAVIEEYIGRTNATYWSNAVTEVFVDDHGSVDHYKIQRESQEAFHFQTLEARTGANAVFSNHSVTLGSKLGRNDIRGKLMGEGGEAICNGLYLLKDRQLFDTHIFMDHAVPKCNSHELYKGILDDKARAVFCGRILVQKDAQQTDAVQSNKNLLLSRTAKINTLPQLEIYADDVKCTHGATVGQLDDQSLYYMQTRGIDPVRAHAMLTFAFANEVLDEVQCEPAKKYIETLIHEWLEEVSA
jgi:Fe-S cluster assembly protein SufD